MEELKEQIASCHSACQRMHTLCLPFSLLLVDRLKAKSHVRADENVAQPSHEWPSEEPQPGASSSSTELPKQQEPQEQIASCHSARQRMHMLCLPFSLLLVDRLKAKSHVRAD